APARLFPAPVGRDIAPGSALLSRLGRGARERLKGPHVSIYGYEDHVGPRGAYLASGERVGGARCGHQSLLYHPRVPAQGVGPIAHVKAAATVRDARVAG